MRGWRMCPPSSGPRCDRSVAGGEPARKHTRMSATTHSPSIDRESCPRLRRWAGTWPAALVGVALLVGCYFLARAGHDGPRRFWLSYTHKLAYFLSLGLGALFFVL